MIEQLKKNTGQKMQKSIDALREELTKIRSGRAHAGLFDHIQVEYYGSLTPIPQVATVSLIDSRTLSVQTWEKNMLSKVEKAIRESNLGLNPSSQGNLLRVPMPVLTEERRKELGKVVRSEGESAKVAIRNIRRDANSQLKEGCKKNEISEDEERRAHDEVQTLTNQYIDQVDRAVTEKEQDLLSL